MKNIRYSLITLFSSIVLIENSNAQQVAQPAEYVLKVTPAELDVISEGLQTQPFKVVAPLMNKLRNQVIEQQPKPEEKKE